MIYLIFGQDTYRTRQSIKELAKKSEADLYRLDLGEDDFSKIRLLAGSGSLFSRKKTLIISKTNLIQPQELSNFTVNFKNSEDTIIFWDEKIDAEKIEIFKNSSVKIQEFKNLTGAHLKNWTQEEAQKRGLRLFPAHWERLENFGGDLWAVSNELDKMTVEDGSTSSPYILSLSKDFQEKTCFNLGDSFFVSKKQGLNDLLRLSAQGEDEFGLFNYLVGHCRTILLAKHYAEKKQPIAADHKIHPYVAKKAADISKSLTTDQLVSKFKQFFEEDFKIKTGLSKPRESLERVLLD